MSSNRNRMIFSFALTVVGYLIIAGAAGGFAVADDSVSPRETVAKRAITLNTDERTLLALINRARTRRGLKALVLRASLYRAAKAHSREMIRLDYFSHLSKAGRGPQSRARRAGYGAGGYSSWSLAEVIAWGRGSAGSPAKVFGSWMRSPAHRAILLGKRWRDIGVGRAKGTFRGLSGVRMYTVDVGRRLR